MEKKIKRLNRLITILGIIVILCIFNLLFALFSFKTPFKQGNYSYNLTYTEQEINLSETEIKYKLQDITGVKLYAYFESNTTQTFSCPGFSIVFLNIIIVDKNISKEQYILTLTHELCHLKYHTLNERWVCYQMFVHLYNSEFKDIALKFADEQRLGYYPIEYNAWGYIEEYLKGEIR